MFTCSIEMNRNKKLVVMIEKLTIKIPHNIML
jgi:hypothetical protein